MIDLTILGIYFAASLFLFSYGMNCYVVVWLYLRSFRRGCETNAAIEKSKASIWDHQDQIPTITTQIPLYNELNVAERAIRAAAALEYPTGKHEVQVLDDSTDETQLRVDQVADELRKQGIDITVIRRKNRIGYKAGALEEGTMQAKGELLAVFDSDFVPNPDFLRRLVPFFLNDSKVGLVQARWGHLNKGHSLFTRTQSLGIDGHFIVEQSARAFSGLYMNFNGTAGIWRKQTIVDAGGWKHDTLTEDLDLSYRAQLAGWKATFVPDVVVPAEIPETVAAFKNQQFRWAKGSIQTALKLLPKLWRSDLSLFQKVQAYFHLTHYAIHPLMVLLALLGLPVILAAESRFTPALILGIGSLMSLATFAPSTLYWFSQKQAGIHWAKRLLGIPILMFTGVGIAISNTRAVLEALLGVESGFVRTPKSGDKALKNYTVKMPILPVLEIVFSLYCWYSVVQFFPLNKWFVAPFLVIYAIGFGYIGLLGLIQGTMAGKMTGRTKKPDTATAAA
ncbi:MAG: glycosyltransferase [Verrucomicrobia bacterium]|nr:glycosyltransferase [Verrucomicrobiota bacterium]